ncbi:Methionine--tRNA ligase cytoplasmic [Penicillium cataractarum]|uniref:methionine--tRNA ligase n=1 Tax=Penicillium cataractarum TaxID=2100454 RepID=A0A9W9V657_9EURO|nr:Methionine--tRNA ligase cytoplasmic [Penicillium cataractarum]KAJ5370167.1 Methionine--tRNA ligase cytoplasmic [Penicillium cataractarum]
MASDPILPKEGERNILITSALPYVNNVPHLGNVVGSVLSADVFSRYHKACGRPTLFICGTDEYGTATETKALEEKVTPEELCAKYNKIHQEVYKWFNIGFDHFGRTPTQKHTEISQAIFKRLYDNGFLDERTAEQPFCEKHGSFLADRYVEGECPRCHYDDARGDQCDKCGHLLDPFDLINPRCKLDGATPVRRETKHIHLLLDKLQPEVEKWSTEAISKGEWPKNSKVITESWLKEGLKDRGITRDLKWGVPVPLEGFENKVLYVWFEACIGYPSITANYTKDWEQWWRNPENVQLYQFLGKDNVPFHSVIFPATQMGTRDKWTMLHHLSATEYLNYESGKFSKSRGIGVFGTNAKETGVGPDVWRYYLLKNRPETGDTQFEWRPFVDANNSELLAKLGNLVNRVIKLVNASFGGVIPEFTVPESFRPFEEEVSGLLKQYIEEMESVHLRAGVNTAMRLAEAGNGLIQANRLDNSLIANEPERAAAVVGSVLNLIHLLASVFAPYMPGTSDSILEQLNAPFLMIPSLEALNDGWKADSLKAGHKIGKAAYLFSRIDPKKADEWREAFGGSQAERAKKAEEAAKLAAKKAAAKAKKKEKKEKGKAPGGVEATAKGGAEKPSVTTDGPHDEAVEKIADGVAQVTLPTS